jgi:DNA-3-methyladenine glycosylase II
MKKIIVRVGPCRLTRRRDYFVVLCDSIFSQQLSTRIAGILFERFRDLFPQRRPTPRRVLKALDLDGEILRRCGLSRQKRAYIHDLAKHFHARLIPTRRFSKMADEQIIESLVRVKGVGRWTAEMFLIFVLNRTDVWPVDDLGLQEAVRKAYALKERPKPKALREFGDRFRPHRTAATWYLWRSLSLKSPRRRSG